MHCKSESEELHQSEQRKHKQKDMSDCEERRHRKHKSEGLHQSEHKEHDDEMPEDLKQYMHHYYEKNAKSFTDQEDFNAFMQFVEQRQSSKEKLKERMKSPQPSVPLPRPRGEYL
eukprot:4809990-Karenia_brevis.AAC.1